MLDVDNLEERNRRTFEDLESMGDKLIASFIDSLFDWSHA